MVLFTKIENTGGKVYLRGSFYESSYGKIQFREAYMVIWVEMSNIQLEIKSLAIEKMLS